MTSKDKEVPEPAGLELLFKCCSAPPPLTPLKTLVLPIHWSIVRLNNRLVLPEDPSIPPSELLPNDWPSMFKQDKESRNTTLTLHYKNQLVSTPEPIQIGIMEFEKNDSIVVYRSDGSTIILKVSLFMDVDRVGEGHYCIKNFGRMHTLLSRLFTEEEREIIHEPDDEDPYASKLTKAQIEGIREYHRDKDRELFTLMMEEARAARQQQPEPDPLRVPQQQQQPDPLRVPPRPNLPPSNPLNPNDPFNIGRGDLDPFGAGGIGGGMLMDPRGFRSGGRGILPGGVRPPRFDPFGPVGGGGFGRLPPHPGLPFGIPDNDLERLPPTAPGYDDMFM